ncbi:MAG: peroxiredoxin [Planctomycetes bacterium]|nr:peroxiredoxin [Planctomycetota bacterium]
MSAHLKVGDRAPAFTLKCTDGRLISLADFAGQKQVVLFFYSKDSSPDDAADARMFRDALERITGVNGELIGLSVDDIYEHRKFVKQNQINYYILSDTTKSVTNAYGVLKKEGYGSRATFVVDKQGLLKAIFPNAQHGESHIEEIIKSLKGQSNFSAGPPKP